ncbi:MAG: vitamin B12-dependent ribonucleotide reductase, partial [Pirellulaceae bacterium]
LSVRVTDEFMETVEKGGKWRTRWVTDPTRDGPGYEAKTLLDRMADCAWHCGDPGVQYDTTINRWHTCPNSGRINASNPCSEYMFLDDTACNLASVNLMKVRKPDGSLDVERFTAACRLFFIAQEILVDHASYPTDRIALNSHLFRPLGLGYSNLGSLIMSLGMPYDSDAARGLCGAVTALLHGAANRTSVELARAQGPFEGYALNREPFLRVMQMHREAVDKIDDAGPRYLKEAARLLWDEVLQSGRRYGFRNAQATVLAPTGTISFLMDCDTTGIEPDIALVKYKQLAGGGMLKIVNNTVPSALRKLGYDDAEVQSIVKHIDEHDTIEGATFLKEAHLPVFDCAFKPANGVRSIGWQAHVRMMAAAQPFISGAISKTVNMPNEVTTQDIADAYRWGWTLGLKALAIYRDGSKMSQPLNTKSEGDKSEKGASADKDRPSRPRRERLPDTRQSMTHKFSVAGHEGYVTVGLYPDGRPGELFITMAKEGSTVGGLMDAFGTAVSISLQYGVPLEALVNKFSHMRFEPMGHTTNPDIRIAKSLIDYMFRWLGITFMPGYRESLGLPPKDAPAAGGDRPAASPAASVTSTAKETRGAQASPAPSGNAAAETRTHAKNGDAAGRTSSPVNANGGGVASPASSNGHFGTQDAIVRPRTDDLRVGQRNEQFAMFQSDAPSCDNCGAITVRNGNCYLCHNCGNSMGCS